MPRRGHAIQLVKEEEEFDSTPLFADPEDVQAFAEDLPEKFLLCREMNHNWRPHAVGSHRDGGFERTLRCPRCKAKKVQHLSPRGGIMSSKYIYPEGYATKGMGRIVGEGRDIMRLVSIQRTFKEED